MGYARAGSMGFWRRKGARAVPPQWAETVERVIRQRLAQHDDLDAVADALKVVPGAHPFASVAELAAVSVPAVIVASDDEADPEHPRAIGEAYAQTIPDALLITDQPGRSPVAWQGSQLSKLIAETVARAG